jgi:hypothetical protein
MVPAARSLLMGVVISMVACGGEPRSDPRPIVPSSAPVWLPYHIYAPTKARGFDRHDGGTNRAGHCRSGSGRGVSGSAPTSRLYVALSGSPIAPPGVDEHPAASRQESGRHYVVTQALKVVTVLGGSNSSRLRDRRRHATRCRERRHRVGELARH